jgi:UDP-N-acetylmuramoyl-tripeptide--D-alanyl-D-alanine ligase
MGLLTVEELREVISVKVLAGDPSLSMRRRIRNISTDSRSIRRGDLFVALKGERFDGHDFVQAVLAKGATGAIVHDTYRWEAKTQKSSGISRHDPFLFNNWRPIIDAGLEYLWWRSRAVTARRPQKTWLPASLISGGVR